MNKKLLSFILTGTILLVQLTGCMGKTVESNSNTTVETSQSVNEGQNTEAADKLKYVFLLIGDGMSTPQIQLTNYYLNAVSNTNNTATANGTEILTSENRLSMLNFPVAGFAQTFDSTSFAPDSASTATSIATGNKTSSGSLNVNEDCTVEYKTICEQLKSQKNYKVGIVTSVNINHATPAAFYAHQPSRTNYYEIGLELIKSNFDYFAGGALKLPTGTYNDQEELYEIAMKQGFRVIRTQKAASALTAKDGKAIVIAQKLADYNTLSYEIDRETDEWSLADYVEKGIEVLNNDNGFFMMVEGGKIDWACHANDAASVINETIAFDRAVEKAIEFYNSHPDETLIIVTGDHETGGLTIGFAGTNYDTFLANFENQKISYAKFNSEYVPSYKENNISFDEVMKDIKALFGLEAPTNSSEIKTNIIDSADSHPESAEDGLLVLTQYEYNKLKEAYETTMERTGNETEFEQEEYEKYGSYEPLTVTITHILNNKSGVNFGSYSHTGLPVAVFAKGVGAEQFIGYYDNTDIYHKLAALTGIKQQEQ
ncbi:alkaline phosphatase [Lachnotalea glycerini]|uniref:Alkaline phosphatase n=1 Tax=Lachnotalea glycerini TaxID=1763509 RepID=A0A318ENA0_9FIRM|nr:alkaline phosphatase [Lachnotalea glycerini]PXV86229.1 alkaline phosphatase [Lachnotalea glycerini]